LESHPCPFHVIRLNPVPFGTPPMILYIMQENKKLIAKSLDAILAL
jgi:hypothetical protein